MRIYVSYIYVSHITVCTVHTHTHIANKCLCTSPTYTHHTSQIYITNIHHKYTSHIHITNTLHKYITHITASTRHTHTHTLPNYANNTLFSGGLENTYLCITRVPAFSWISHNTFIHYSQELQRTHISLYLSTSLYISLHLKHPHSPGRHTTHTYIILRRSSEPISLNTLSTRILLYVTQHTH